MSGLTNVVFIAVTVFLLAGCNGGEKPERNPGARSPDARSTALTPTQKTAGRIAVCLREDGPRVATDANAVRSRVLSAAKGETLRISWKRPENGADLYVGATRADTTRTRGVLRRSEEPYEDKRVLVLYDEKPTIKQSTLVGRCLDEAGI